LNIKKNFLCSFTWDNFLCIFCMSFILIFFYIFKDEESLELLKSGLQLSPNTTVIINETLLENGKLNNLGKFIIIVIIIIITITIIIITLKGCENLLCLQKAVKQQLLNYKFPYYEKVFFDHAFLLIMIRLLFMFFGSFYF
jgi:hypothetical protein